MSFLSVPSATAMFAALLAVTSAASSAGFGAVLDATWTARFGSTKRAASNG